MIIFVSPKVVSALDVFAHMNVNVYVPEVAIENNNCLFCQTPEVALDGEFETVVKEVPLICAFITCKAEYMLLAFM